MRFKYIILAMAVVLLMLIVSSGAFAYDQYENPIRVQIGTSVHTVKADSGNYQVLDEQGNVVQSVTQGKSVELQPGQRFSSVNG
ncbi:MAG TPA: hypothetical protein H9669_08575, partial [Firmicutes bacterium]|nr:hypothetical protein [Bacillota bacterium]